MWSVNVVGMWSVSGRYVVGMWSVCDRYVVGMWSVTWSVAWSVTWSVSGWYVVGKIYDVVGKWSVK